MLSQTDVDWLSYTFVGYETLFSPVKPTFNRTYSGVELLWFDPKFAFVEGFDQSIKICRALKNKSRPSRIRPVNGDKRDPDRECRGQAEITGTEEILIRENLHTHCLGNKKEALRFHFVLMLYLEKPSEKSEKDRPMI